jgi:hypothetical protein
MAPEQAEGRVRDLGTATDVYALGAILYELLTGRPPFRAPTLLATLEQVRTQEPASPSSLQPGLPPDLEAVCLQCLRKEPGARYAGAGALAADLERFLGGEPVQARSLNLTDRLARLLNRSEDFPAVHALGRVIQQALSAVPFLSNLLLFLLAGGSSAYPALAVGLTLLTVLGFAAIVIWVGWSFWVSLPAVAARHFWSIRICHTLGMLLVPLLGWQLSGPGRPWDPLTAFPWWALVTGICFFPMGGQFWGRLYLVGLAFLALAVVMPLRLEWAPLEFGLTASVMLLTVGTHLRRQTPPDQV